MRLSGSVKGSARLRRLFHRINRVGNNLPYYVDQLLDMTIDIIRRDYEKTFTHELRGKGIDPKSGLDTLAKGLWKSDPRPGDPVVGSAGWSGDGAIYGPVLEWGPRKKSWIIKPRNNLARGHGPSPIRGKYRKAEDPVMALRFFSGGKIVYRKSATRRWTDRSRRPHFRPAFVEARKAFIDSVREELRGIRGGR